MAELRIIKTNEKILIWMHRENISQLKLAEKLDMTRQTLAQRLKDNCFTPSETMKLNNLGCFL